MAPGSYLVHARRLPDGSLITKGAAETLTLYDMVMLGAEFLRNYREDGQPQRIGEYLVIPNTKEDTITVARAEEVDFVSYN